MVAITQMTLKIIGPRATHFNFQVLRYLHLHGDHVLVMLHRMQHIYPACSTLVLCRLSVDHGQLESRSPSQQGAMFGSRFVAYGLK